MLLTIYISDLNGSMEHQLPTVFTGISTTNFSCEYGFKFIVRQGGEAYDA